MPGSPSTLADLRSLLAARFPEKTRKPGGGVPTGVRALDEALGGGLPAGRLTELVSGAPSSGGQTVLTRLLLATRAARQRVALIDAADGFAPETVPADALRHLVWVRGRNLGQTFSAADLLVRDGNYAVIVFDVRGVAERALHGTPASLWYRLHRAVEGNAVAILVLTPSALVPAVPWRLVLNTSVALADCRKAQAVVAAGLTVEIARGHLDAREELAG